MFFVLCVKNRVVEMLLMGCCTVVVVAEMVMWF